MKAHTLHQYNEQAYMHAYTHVCPQDEIQRLMYSLSMFDSKHEIKSSFQTLTHQ